MNQTSKIIEKLQKNYKFIEERPWKKYPEYITLKDEESRKWFAAFLQTSAKNLGLSNMEKVGEAEGYVYQPDEIVPIVNVKADPEVIHMLTQSRGILPGYHMNKEHWISILVDGTVEISQILTLIEDSYQMITDSPTKRIYEAVRKVPRGKVATYGQIAAMAGNPKMSRAVGNALHKNPDGDKTPCYRIVNSKGELAEAFVFGGINIQKERLEADGIEVVDNHVDLEKYAIDLQDYIDKE